MPVLLRHRLQFARHTVQLLSQWGKDRLIGSTAPKPKRLIQGREHGVSRVSASDGVEKRGQCIIAMLRQSSLWLPVLGQNFEPKAATVALERRTPHKRQSE